MIEGQETEPPPRRARILLRPRLEREEQRIFAAWLALNALPYCWHATHKRSNATVGVFDFWVGKDGSSSWIEFKIDPGAKLSPAQEEFQTKLSQQKCQWHLVYSAAEAIAIVKSWGR